MKRLSNAPITSDQAVSVVVGALLIVSIMMIAAVQYQNNVIPAQEQQTEFDHNREVRSQLQHLRSNIIATSSSGQIRTTPVQVGTRFEQQFIFGFLPAVQSPNPAGTLETYNVTAERNQNITLTGVNGRGGASNYWQATNQYNYSTSFLNYSIDYARYQNPPETYYENTILYERTGPNDEYAIQSQQTLVQGKNINLIALSGDIGTTTTSEVNVQTQPVSAPAQTIVVESPPESDGGPMTISFPTNLPASEWCSINDPDSSACNGGDGAGILDNQLKETGGGYIEELNYNAGKLEIVFVEDETFTLKLSRVHLQTQQDQTVTPQIEEEYVAWLGSEQITFRENTRHTVTAQVRDRYNNPVEGVATVATAFHADDEDDCIGDFVNWNASNQVPGCDYQQPGERTSGENGEVTYFYDTPQVNDDTRINLNIELANNSDYGYDTSSLADPNPQLALAGADTYSAVNLGDTVESSDTDGDTGNAQQNLGNGQILYNHNEESQINGEQTFRVLDARLNKSQVVTGRPVRVNVIVDNTGIDTKTAYLALSSSDSTNTTIKPNTFPISIDPGEQIRYEYTVTFDETGNYTLSLSNTNIDKNVQVLEKSSSVYDGSIYSAVEDQSIAKVVTSYKDENTNSDHPAYNSGIPPVVQGPNGTFINDAEGIIYDFGDAQNSGNDASLSLEGNETADELKLGLAFENVPEQNHYTIQLNYNISEGNEPVQMQVVQRDGTSVDPKTKYMLGADADQMKTKYFTLSKEEADYIRDHKNIYLVFTADGHPTVDINYMRALSSENILDTTSGNTNFDDFRVTNAAGVPTEEFSIFQPVYITVEKTNTGNAVVEEQVQIEENGQVIDSKTVRYNPGETKTTTFIKYKPEGVYTYASRNYDATTITVGDPDMNANQPPIPQITSTIPTIQNRYVPTGASVGDDRTKEFTLDATESYDPNGDTLTYTWEIDGTQVATGPTLDETHFTTDGTKQVTLIVDDGETKSAIRTRVAINDIEPTALFSVNPSSVPTNSTAEFDASQALDQDGEIQRYIWKVDGIEVANNTDNPFALHDFTEQGNHEVTLTTVDDDGNRQSRTTTISVFDADVVADYEYSPTDPQVGDEIIFDASQSSADNSTIETYEWRLSDGTVIGTGETITKNFEQDGEHTVELYIETSDGKNATATRTISVRPPFEAVANADPETASPGETIYFDAYGSTDPQGLIEDYSWTLGDGTTASGQETFHDYGNPGTYDVTVTIKGNGYQDTDTVTVRIREDKPIAIPQPSNVTAFLSENVTLYGDESYHPSATLTYYNWQLGDGTTVDQENVIGHNYTQPTVNVKNGEITQRHRQPYNATLTVTDEYGNTDTNSTFVEIRNRGPLANWTANETPTLGHYEIYSGTTIEFDGSVSTHEEAPEGTIQSYEWIVNGTTQATTQTYTRTWNQQGNYSLKLKLTDQYNGTGTNSTYVIVHPDPTARLTADPSTVNTGQATRLNASMSTPGGPDGTTIEEYRWDFDGDGTIDHTTTSTSTVNHAYTTPDKYNATVTIVNSDGQTATDNVTITVEESASNSRTYVIENPTDKSTTNYQVNITVQNAANIDSDYGSIRFYQDGNQLDYHRVSYDSTSALFVVELDRITATGAVVNMTYGGDRTTASNPEATYLVYDYHGNGMDDGTFYGSAYDVNGAYARLTEAVDGQQGSLRYGTHDVGLKAQYDWRVRDGTGADSVNFVTFNNGNRYEHENASGNGIHFSVVDHDNCVAVNYNAECQYTTSYSQDHNWHQASAEISETGINTGNYNYIFDSGASGAGTLSGTLSAPGIGNQFGFSGRTGGLNNYHEVREITIRKWLGQPMRITPVQGEGIDGFERGNMNPYIVSDSSYIRTSPKASTQGGTSLAIDVSAGGNHAYSNSGLPHYPQRGDYITARMNFKDGYFSWGQTYGTRLSIGFGGTGSTPAYTAYIKGNNGQQLQLQANGHGTVDSTYVNWGAYEDQWLRLHIDYDAHGDGMIRVHLLSENNNRIATVSFHDPNGPNGGNQLYFGMVGDTNREGTIYIDEIKTTPNQIYTDDWDKAGFTNWNQASGSWSISGDTLREDSSFNGNTLINPNFKMNVSQGVYIKYDTWLGGTWANYNRVYLRTSSSTTNNRVGLGHDNYNSRGGLAEGYAGGGGTQTTGQNIPANTWHTIDYQYNPDNNGECIFNYPSGSTGTGNCVQPNDPISQQLRIGGWSHNAGDQYRNLYIKRNYSNPVTDISPVYSHGFQSSYNGWTTETGLRTLKSGDNNGGWMTAGCSLYDQTNTFTKNLGSHHAEQITYEIRLAAIDSWDGETLRFQILDDSGWNTVESTTPSNSYGEQTSLDCHTNNGWLTTTYTWSGTFTPTGDIQAIRVNGDIQQDDDDESIGIDYVNITRTN